MNERIKKGDLFSVSVDEYRQCFFQFIGNDMTQLNSDVIRVFKKKYEKTEEITCNEIIMGEVAFHAHCIIKLGIKLGYWEKKCHVIANVTTNDILFRSSEDDGKGSDAISNNWWIWKINEEQKKIGKLTGEYRLAEIGSVIPPDSIVHRIKTGEYDFIYPSY